MTNTNTAKKTPMKFHFYREQFTKITAWYHIKEQGVGGQIRPVNYFGSVTVQDGKMKISIEGRNYLSYYDKRFIEDTVRNAFLYYRTSPIFTSYTEVKNDLISELRNNTQDLKADYFVKCQEAADRMFKYRVGQIETLKAEMDELQSVIRSQASIKDAYSNLNRTEGTKEWWNLRSKYCVVKKQYDESIQMKERGYEKFLKTEMEYAEAHYESSLIKLASRLADKGVEGDMEITSGRVGHNFEVNITHSKGVTRAWTIIAEGPIVRAHYRYLVK